VISSILAAFTYFAVMIVAYARHTTRLRCSSSASAEPGTQKPLEHSGNVGSASLLSAQNQIHRDPAP
jgi:hypothetical protein